MRQKFTFARQFQTLIFVFSVLIQSMCVGQNASFIQLATPDQVPDNQEIADYKARLRTGP
jgi:hypothetical protein